ncbi:MAG: hypothetical protein Q9168_003254 [Polycauliona sp. 1 TL-2023]
MMDPPSPTVDLLGLPNEILLRILEHGICHKDLENVTLSCKTIFDLAKLAREKHLKIKERFSTFIVGDLQLYNGTEEPIINRSFHPVFALQELLANRDVAVDYCQTLKIGGVAHGGYVTSQYEDDVTEEAVSITQDLELQLKALAEQEPFKGNDDWFEQQLEGTYDLAYAIPLTFLHNITVLELVNCSDFLQRIDRDVWDDHKALAAMRDSHHRLQEIRLFGNHEDGGEDMEVFASFADLPSVRRLHGLHVTAESKRSEGCFLFEQASHITEIHLECSSIESFYLERLLGFIEGLEKFYYEHNRSINEMILHSGRGIICALRQYARETLQTLTYFDSSPETTAEDESVGCHLPSLHDFLVLRHVAIEYALFKPESSSECNEDDNERMYKLVDIMPSSLETLELYGRISKAEASFLFDAFCKQRKSRLPKLRKISVQRECDLDQSIQNDCEELGIEFAVVAHPTKKYPHEDY